MKDAQITKLPVGVYPIPAYRGLRMVVGSGGTRSWSWRHRNSEGKLKQEALGTWPKVTMQEAISAIESRKAGNTDPTVGDLVGAYIEGHLRICRKSPQRTVYMLEKHLAEMWDEKARLIDRAVGQKLLNGLRDRNATAHMLRRELMAIWEFAGLENNPWARLKTRPNPPRQRCLTDTELVGWYGWVTGRSTASQTPGNAGGDLSRTVQDVLMLMLLTGCRSGELCAMEWADVNLDAGEWHLRGEKTKNKMGRTVYLSEWAIEILRDRMRLMGGNTLWAIGRGRESNDNGPRPMYHDNGLLDESISSGILRTAYSPIAGPATPRQVGVGSKPIAPSTKYVFPSRTGKAVSQHIIMSAVWRARPTCPVQHATIHDTRRLVRSSLARLGCPDPVGEAILGHKPQGILAVYQTYKWDKEQRTWLDVWCAYLRDLLTPK